MAMTIVDSSRPITGGVDTHLDNHVAAALDANGGLLDVALGGRLSAELELLARRGGDTEIVVSATPSENTVRFYLGRGYRPMAQPLPELLDLEPEDVHMGKPI
jgi:hypothetical protein